MTKLTPCHLVTSILSACAFCIAGCDSNQNTNTNTTPTAPTKSKKALRAERFAGVTDPATLIEGWKEELLENGFFKIGEDGELTATQFAYEYTWRFDGPNAHFSVVQIDGPDGRPLPGSDVAFEFVDDLHGFWAGEGETPRFIRAIDGENGDQVIIDLQEKIVKGGLRQAEDKGDQNSIDALNSPKPSVRQLIAYNVLNKTGEEFESETVMGNLFEFRATALFREDGKIEGHFFAIGRDPGGQTAGSDGNDKEEVNE